MRSALAARMYAAVQLSSQQQQMYVNKKNLYEKKMQLIIYQRFIIRKKICISRCLQVESEWERENVHFVNRVWRIVHRKPCGNKKKIVRRWVDAVCAHSQSLIIKREDFFR